MEKIELQERAVCKMSQQCSIYKPHRYSLRPSRLAGVGSACSLEALKRVLETTEQSSEENFRTPWDLKKNR